MIIETYTSSEINIDIKSKVDFSGIYCIENLINGKRYIGQSINIYSRWVSHIRALNKGEHNNSHLQASWEKYSQEAFIFYVVEKCSVKKLDKREQ